MSAWSDALAWEASYRVWRRRARPGWQEHDDSPATHSLRETWAGEPAARGTDGVTTATEYEDLLLLAIRVRQARRWLKIEAREHQRQETLKHKQGR